MSLKYPWVCLEEEVTPWLLIRTTAGCATDVSLRAAEQWQMLFHKRCSGPIENKSSHKRRLPSTKNGPYLCTAVTEVRRPARAHECMGSRRKDGSHSQGRKEQTDSTL